MTLLAYERKKLSDDRLRTIGIANEIIEEYEKAGLSLTLRQLYYQFVARGLIENSDRSYDRLGSAINDGRMGGLISWTAIEDRTRNLMGINTFRSPAELLRSARSRYAKDLWRDQEWRPEVWVEKDALVGVIGGICQELRVDYFACRGYNSQSEQWRAGQRLARYVQKGQRPIIFHLGDHDPSGIDMTRDNTERLGLFAGTPVMVVRLALNMDQVRHYNPPPNPAKLSDSRARDYVSKFGDESWELDALDPRVIQRLIRENVERIRNESIWQEALADEAADLDEIDIMIERMTGGDEQ